MLPLLLSRPTPAQRGGLQGPALRGRLGGWAPGPQSHPETQTPSAHGSVCGSANSRSCPLTALQAPAGLLLWRGVIFCDAMTPEPLGASSPSSSVDGMGPHREGPIQPPNSEAQERFQWLSQ